MPKTVLTDEQRRIRRQNAIVRQQMAQERADAFRIVEKEAGAYQPKVQTVDAGRYSFRITNDKDGAATVSVVYTTADQGIQTVLYVVGHADPRTDGQLLVAVDPYDATHNMGVQK